MRLVIAPDAFAGTLSASQAAAAIAEGWRRSAPDDVAHLVPMSDGGPGFVEVLHSALGGSLVTGSVVGPLGHPVGAQVLLVGDTAYLEVAQACGLHLVPSERRDPRVTSTAGVGGLIELALDAGASRIVLGLGGTATTDAGAGMLGALGARAADADGRDVSDRLLRGGAALRGIRAVDLRGVRERLAGVALVAASDVDVPLLGLRGAANGFARQKGADDAAVAELEGCLESFATAVGRRPDGTDPALALGAGAAGGLGYALLALGGSRVPGIATVLELVGLERQIASTELVVTGEGAFDWQSLRGKVVSGVAGLAVAHGRACLVLAGRVDIGRREYGAAGVSGAMAVVDDVRDRGLARDRAWNEAGEALADLAERAARTWSR